MKKQFIFIILFILFSVNLSARTLHVIMFVNVKEQGREIDRKADYDNMKREFTEIASYLEAKLNLLHYSDANFTAANAESICKNLSCTKDDMIVFYYSGHGANDKTVKWPVMGMKDRLLKMSNVIQLLRAHETKFLMVVADCCNSYFNGSVPPSQNNPISEDIYKKLFYDFKGKKQVLVSASIPGQVSYSHSKSGAYFGICMREAIHRNTTNAAAKTDWNVILEDAKKLTLSATGSSQIPQFEVVTQADASEE